MTNKDYIVLADLLYKHKGANRSLLQIRDFVEDLCQYLKEDNPKFDKSKFLKSVYRESPFHEFL